MGTSDFAVPSLEALVRSPDFEVAAIVTQMDRPRDRGHQVKFSPVKDVALREKIPVYQPVKVRAEEFRPVLEGISAEVIVVAAYGQILPEWILGMKRFGSINVHASLLPRHRGAAPVHRAILQGDSETGITIMQMDAGLDSGPVLLQEATPIGPDETGGELHDRLAIMGAELLLRGLRELQKGALLPVPQDHSQATKAAKIGKEESVLLWSQPAAVIHNQVRAFNPWPGALAHFRDREIKIWRTALVAAPSAAESGVSPGLLHVEKGSRLLACCGNGSYLEIIEVSLPGRKRISGADLIHGHRITSGESFACVPA